MALLGPAVLAQAEYRKVVDVGLEPELFEKMSRELDEHAAAGDLRPLVSRRCTLEEVPQALRDIGDRKALGKIVAVP